jgi:hypothetical protein
MVLIGGNRSSAECWDCNRREILHLKLIFKRLDRSENLTDQLLLEGSRAVACAASVGNLYRSLTRRSCGAGSTRA